MVFGLLFVQAGGAAWLAVASSLLVYAGAAQFMMVPMLAAGMPVGSIVLATLVINLRHVFYGLSLLENMPAARWRCWYVIYAFTDESWSVLTALPHKQRAEHMTVLSALNQLWWVGGTLAGAPIGARAELGLNGLDFALAALFAVLAAEQWRSRRDWGPVWVARGSYAGAAALVPDHVLKIGRAHV